MVRGLVDYFVDKNNHLVRGFQHSRQASVSQENIDTYPDELEVPSVLMKAVSASEDSDNIRQIAKSTYTNDRRDDDTSSSDNDGNTAAEDEGATSRDHDDGAAYVIPTATDTRIFTCWQVLTCCLLL